MNYGDPSLFFEIRSRSYAISRDSSRSSPSR
jgi:hypothetical protein